MSCGFNQYPPIGSASNPSQIEFADSVALDSFGRLRVSQPTTLFDSQQEYGLDTVRTWDGVANGTYSTGSSNGSVTNGSNSVGPTNSDTRMTPVTVSSTDTHYSILQSRQYTRYIPGKSHLVFITGIFVPRSGCAMAIVRRTSTSGSVVDNSVAQSSWNIDKFDGTGPSGITLDFTKTQILAIQAQWLGVGRVIIGFDVNGVLYPAHQFLNSNVLDVPYTQTFNLPVRFEARCSGTTNMSRAGYFDAYNGSFLQGTSATAGGTINFVCASVQSEGGEEMRGFPLCISNGTTAISVTTRRSVLSIRPKATYNSRTNRAHIELADYIISAQTNGSFYEIVVGGTLGGVPSWTSVGANSVVEYDVSGTTVTGGQTIVNGYVLAGTGIARGESSGAIDIRNPFVLRQVDSLTANQDVLSIVCTSLTGTSSVLAAINWHEQTT